jgi:hypothetical protein
LRMNVTRVYSSATVLPNQALLMISGYSSSVQNRFLTACEKLDLATNTWSSAANVTVGRSDHSTVLFNNIVVMMGGYVGSSTFLKSCEQYDPISDSWSDFPSMGAIRSEFGAAVVLGKIYIAGGVATGRAFVASAEVYDGTAWSFLSSSLAQVREGCAAVAFQNKFVILGGGGATTLAIEVFDPITSSWNTTFPPMQLSPDNRAYLGAISF